MSTDQTSGQQAEQQPQAADAAGCKSEMNRSVQGTDLGSGFAELRARAWQEYHEAVMDLTHANSNRLRSPFAFASGKIIMATKIIAMIDALEAAAKDAST
jgi:hypothetical protein